MLVKPRLRERLITHSFQVFNFKCWLDAPITPRLQNLLSHIKERGLRHSSNLSGINQFIVRWLIFDYIWHSLACRTCGLQKQESKNLFDSPLAASIQYIVKILCFFVQMLKIFPKKFKEQSVVKENKKIFWNIHKHSVFNLESSKLINCLMDICWSCPWHIYSSIRVQGCGQLRGMKGLSEMHQVHISI
jgi:hypothetical protein